MKRAMIAGVLVALAALLAAPSFAASVSDYVKAGLPSPDRLWTGADYQKFAELLKGGQIELPMLSSDETRPIFLALVNRDGLAFYANKELSIGVRMDGCVKTYAALPPVLMQYVERHNGGKANCSREMARLMAFVLHISTSLVNLTQEFLPTVPKDDAYEARMAGFEQMKSGLRTIWVGAADSLAERKTYADAEVLIMAEAMIEELPAQKKFLGATAVLELRTKIAALLKNEKSDKVRDALQRLLEKCEAPAAK